MASEETSTPFVPPGQDAISAYYSPAPDEDLNAHEKLVMARVNRQSGNLEAAERFYNEAIDELNVMLKCATEELAHMKRGGKKLIRVPTIVRAIKGK